MAILVLREDLPENNINSIPINNIKNNIATPYYNGFYTIDPNDTIFNSNSILFNNKILSSISSDIDIDQSPYTNSIVDMYYIWDEYLYILSTFVNDNPINNTTFAPFYPIRIYI